MAGLNPGAGSSLRAERIDDGETPVIQLVGELDISSVDQIRSLVDDAVSGHPQCLVFDMSRLTFMDSSGLALLLVAARDVSRIELHHTSDVVRQVIEMTGLGDTLHLA